MKLTLAALAVLFSFPGYAGTLSVTLIKDPNGGAAASGLYTHLGAGQLNWDSFGASVEGSAIVMRGLLTSTGTEPFGGIQPANFRVDFTGSDYPTVAMDFQGILTSAAQFPAVDGLLQWTIHTVIFTGVPTYSGTNLIEVGPDQLYSLTTSGFLDSPTGGKQVLDGHEETGPIPDGPFYGYTILSLERLDGTLDFTDPLTVQFGPVAADVPEPRTFFALAGALAVLALKRHRTLG
ncbi:MAG: PEP-CTERM sorting domain-containing protein [Acidobacteria bacterium]|nr:PEP-CTERM sorting domain-containing protein [Acidobacteriota bacterium]